MLPRLGRPNCNQRKPAWVHADGIVLRPRAHSTVLFLQAINGSILFQLFQILNSTTSSSLYEPGTPTGSGAKVAGGRRRLRGDGRPVAGHAGAGRRADDPGPLPPAAPLRGGRPPQLRQLHAENTGN